MAPHTLDVRPGHPVWPLARVLADGSARSHVVIDDLRSRFRGSSVESGDHAPTCAMVLAICPAPDKAPTGVLICGVNPRMVLDDVYLAFLDLVAARVSASLAEAYARQTDRERLERLAELDRAKTEFFRNVSREFRTPLTLLLAPLEELLRPQDQFPNGMVEQIQLAARNARHLLNQVNTLLDFSQAEERRLRPRFEPIDLAALTRDIVSLFHSAVDRGGLRLPVECPPLAEPVWVDPQMWERIVSNLLSNAVKFTFDGEIVVSLHERARRAELVVRDTGVGIPTVDQPQIFKRHLVPRTENPEP
jgi:signal transduction histidine kinase